MDKNQIYQSLLSVNSGQRKPRETGRLQRPTADLRSIESLFNYNKNDAANIWSTIRDLHTANIEKDETDIVWPLNVFLPSTIWLDTVQFTFGDKLEKISSQINGSNSFNALLAQTMCLGTWRYSQGIYKTDDYAFTMMTGKQQIPFVDSLLLKQMPEWCIYVDLNDHTNSHEFLMNGQQVYGFYALLDVTTRHNDYSKSPDQLIIVFDTHSTYIAEKNLYKPPYYATFSLDRNGLPSDLFTFGFGIDLDRDNQDQFNNLVSPYLSLLSLICWPETVVENLLLEKPHYKITIQAGFSNRKYKLTAPSNPRIWSVGIPYGIDYRNAKRFCKDHPESKAKGLRWIVWVDKEESYITRLRLDLPKATKQSDINESEVELAAQILLQRREN